jgi:hypothetical protein
MGWKKKILANEVESGRGFTGERERGREGGGRREIKNRLKCYKKKLCKV